MQETGLKRNMLWNAAGNLLYMACQWVVTVLVANLGKSFYDAGVLSIAMSVTATFRTLALFGIRNFQVSDVEGKYTDTCYVGFRLITCSAALLLCMAFSLTVGYGTEQIFAILWFMLFHLAENFSDVLHGIAQKNGRLDVAGKSFAIKGVGLLIAFLACYLLTDSLNAGLAAMAIFSCMTTLLFDWVVVRRLSVFSITGGKGYFSLAKETAPLCVYLFLSVAITSIPKLLLGELCGEELLGVYSSIFAPALLIQAAMGYLYNPFAQALGEHRQNGDRKAFLRLSARLTAAIAVLTALIMAVGYWLGDWALTLIFGEKIAAHVDLFMPILAAVATVAYFTFLCMLSTVLRDFLWLVIACAVGVLSEVLFTVPWIKWAGVNATSYSCILSAGIASVILLARILWILLSRRERRP